MQKTSVTFLLDRTGSMEVIKDDTIGGFNAYLEGLQGGAASDDTEFSLVQFDSMSLDKVCVNKPVKGVDKLTKETYEPRASTPLIDAAYKTIKAVETAVAGSDKKVVICIQTDGQENASTEHTWDELNALIKEKSNLGWQFNFMGVGIDAYKQASMMGIARGSTISTTMDPGQMRAAYRGSALNTALYASGATATTDFSDDQKAAAGDYTAEVQIQQSLLRQKTVSSDKVRSRSPIVDDVDLTK